MNEPFAWKYKVKNPKNMMKYKGNFKVKFCFNESQKIMENSYLNAYLTLGQNTS